MKSKRLLRIVSLTLLGATVLSSAPTIANAAWKKNNTGWWYTEGSSWATGWRNISGTWYYFDANGYMKTGWIKNNGTWYYLKSSGAMATGWVKDNGTWYYLSGSGAMKTGWLNDRGTWYYLGGSGAMKTGWLKDKGTWYFLKQSGAMASNEVIEYSGSKYSLEASGAMTTGWKNIGNDTYYFNSNGDAAKGIKEIDSAKYYFELDTCKLLRNGKIGQITTDKDGKITSSVNPGWNSISSTKRYYIDEDGSRHKGWLEYNNKKYYTDEEGITVDGVHEIDGKLYYFNWDGELNMEPGMVNYNSVTYSVSPKAYINEDGTFAKGWKTIDGKKYYFDENGASKKGVQKINSNSEEYYFNSENSALVTDADYYGITTNEKGQVTKINNDLAKNDILKNDSKFLDELKEKYEDVTLEYKGIDSIKNIQSTLAGISNSETGKHYNYKEDGEVFWFRCESKKDKKSYADYYVSVKTGKVYVEYSSEKKQNDDKAMHRIEDNKQIESYNVSYKCVLM